MSKRIRDRRSGKGCNYKALAEEVSEKARRERIPWRKAAEQVASLVNDELKDSVVRNLNRHRPSATSSSLQPPPPSEIGPMPGLAMLYRNIEERLKLIDQELEKTYPQSDEFYEIHAQRLLKIRGLLEGLRDLALSLKEPALRMLAGLVADLGERDHVFGPSIIYEGELELVKMLIERTRRLQNEVATLRPKRTWEEF